MRWKEIVPPRPNTQETRETAPAKPGKMFLCVVAMTLGFYLVDCILVTLFQDHPDTPWIEWGVHAHGPAGFGITVIAFLVGVVTWLREVARQADERPTGATSVAQMSKSMQKTSHPCRATSKKTNSTLK